VHKPDVYFLTPGSIIKDVISAAGGATEEADLEVVNQALELKDQQHIHIPAKAEALPTPPVVEGGVSPQSTEQPAGGEGQSQGSAPSSSDKINLNSATIEQLDLLPGIGPAIAQRIIDYRQAKGPFAAIEDITNVKGIGPATFEKLKDLITVD
jgi:competence protein ComEA